MNQPPKLPRQCAKQTQAHNQFLRAAQGKQIAQTGLTLYASHQAPSEKCALLLSFSFQNTCEMKIGFQHMPLIKQINTLCAPWKLHELSSELVRAALTHIFNDLFKTLPDDINLHDWRLNTNAPPESKDSQIHIGCTLKNQTTLMPLDIWTAPDFPFSQLAQQIGLRPSAQKIWPSQLYVSLPIDIAAAHVSAKTLPTLSRGDVIFLSPCR